MEPVRQCQVRLQIERTQAKAESSQTNMQLALHHIQQCVLTQKDTEHTNQPSKTTTHPQNSHGLMDIELDSSNFKISVKRLVV